MSDTAHLHPVVRGRFGDEWTRVATWTRKSGWLVASYSRYRDDLGRAQTVQVRRRPEDLTKPDAATLIGLTLDYGSVIDESKKVPRPSWRPRRRYR